MQTECPNCHTVFRVTEAQLDIADGMVRCGFCKHVFNARPVNDVRDEATGAETAAQDHNHEDQAPAARPAGDEPGYDSLAAIDHDVPDLAAIDESAAYGQARPYSTAATVAWSLAILALIAALFAEYVWFNQPELLQHQRYEPLTEKLCALTDCDHLQKRDPTRIEMVSRNVYTHPNEKEALMIATTLVNQASFAQPYPDVQIDFSNVRGELVASRRFLPEEYLQLGREYVDLLESGGQADFALEIRDPGRDAITYEFSFH
jgi:predicted Zn finger-like uncharacterized protein